MHAIYKAEALVKSTIENAEFQADEMQKSELYTDRREVTVKYQVDEPSWKKARERRRKKS